MVQELVATDYVQHDKAVPGAADGQVKQFKDVKAKIPGAVATVEHVAADGDLVAVHWHASATLKNEADAHEGEGARLAPCGAAAPSGRRPPP
ncbi:putative exported protein [Streptomyces viridochromogenes Tue57]|uniref:Putative exported protein n=1 Tax=Streptomyces viridochromogenes Tue57 TaxID=1160705 RepID=L8PFP2_STRVR|nr:putative exported protein [Streptomyces viridochromogenes Tue57]